MNDKTTNLIWMDLEMTGLNPKLNRIIEMATIVTDKDLNILAEGPNIAIHQDDILLDTMSDWCKTTHKKNGLIQRIKDSKISEAMAEQLTLDFLKEYSVEKASPICGNTIAQDKRFLVEYMPTLADFFHYRYLDVTTIKILATRWGISLPESTNNENHLALGDIRHSIEELKYYKEHIFKI